jgi:methionyl-tRNA formyltransferase
MKLIFAGTPDFAAAALEALLAAGHEIALVLTQPDRPAGRGMKLKPSPVKTAALAHGLRVEQPKTLRTPDAQTMLADVGAELMVVAAYGLILPQAVLDIPPRGCLNIHASLLPRWRGAAPIQRAIEAGDAQSGITIMQMDAGLDTGAMLSVHPVTIDAQETGATLHGKLAATGAQAIVATLAGLDRIVAQAQPEEGVCYAHKLDKQEAAIDWTRPAVEIARKIRAFDPFPGAHTLLGGVPLKVWMALESEGSGEPGEVLSSGADGIRVACGTGAVCLTVLQPAGSRRMSARDFCAGRDLAAGTCLGGETPMTER